VLLRPALVALTFLSTLALTPAGAMAAPADGGDGEPRLAIKDSQYGKVLFADGFALYLFTADGKRSNCYGSCAAHWPPVVVERRPVVGASVREELVGTVKRADGSRQLTYAGNPVYYWRYDPRGQVLCHDVFEFGGDWLAIRRSGRPAAST
jgi:predicted lipoprotein with Yx(FWY)xxD motif